MMIDYDPTAADRAFCAAFDWHCTAEQRAAVRRYADDIEPPPPDLTPEQEQALAWVRAEDDAGNATPFEGTRYVFGAHGYTGALGWLVDLVQYRRARRWQIEQALALYNGAA
jgi:hypothetical protein